MKKCVFIIAVLLLLSSCSLNKNVPLFKKSEYLLGTFVTVSVYDFGTADEDVVNECFSLILEYEQKFSYYNESSELHQMNLNAYKEPIAVNDDLFDVISSSLEYCRRTDGALDIGLGKLIEIWDTASENGIPPLHAEISEFIGFNGYEHIVLDYSNKSILFDDERVAVHLGACAKGYVEDKIAYFLNENGVKSALLDFGGSLIAIGNKNGEPFRAGITNPDSEGGIVGLIDIADTAVVTSGNYQRYFEYNNVIYHHILDSATAYPSESDINGVTIICDSAFIGDCYSTAAFVVGSEKAAEMLGSENFGYIIITDNSIVSHGVTLKNGE